MTGDASVAGFIFGVVAIVVVIGMIIQNKLMSIPNVPTPVYPAVDEAKLAKVN